MACSYKRPQEPSSPTTNCSYRDDGQTSTTTRPSACFKVYCSPAAFCQTSGCHCWKMSRLHAEPELPYGWRTCQSNMARGGSTQPDLWAFPWNKITDLLGTHSTALQYEVMSRLTNQYVKKYMQMFPVRLMQTEVGPTRHPVRHVTCVLLPRAVKNLQIWTVSSRPATHRR